jgi:hypothetical protein
MHGLMNVLLRLVRFNQFLKPFEADANKICHLVGTQTVKHILIEAKYQQ